jgi:hypothetical protein
VPLLLQVVSICPNFIMGPVLTPEAAGTSIGFFKVCGCFHASLSLNSLGGVVGGGGVTRLWRH